MSGRGLVTPPDLGALHEKTPVAVFVGVLAGERLIYLHRGHRASPEELSTLFLNGVRSGQSGPVPRPRRPEQAGMRPGDLSAGPC